MLVGAGLLVYTVTAAVPPLDNNDIWIHLTTGRLILDEVSVPRSDRYSFTAAGNRYVAHEWLAAAVYAMAERAAGNAGVVVVAKVIPTVAIVAMLFGVVSATRVPWGLALPVLVLTLTVVRYRILARPELLALPILLAMLALLWRDRESARSGGQSRAVFWLVPLEGLWANLHGSFPLGIVLVLVFALAETARRLLASRDRRAHRVRVVGVAGALATGAWLASLEPRAFGVAAAVTVVAFAGLFAADGIRPLFDDARAAASDPLRLIGLAAGMTAVAAINPLGTEIYAFPFEFTAGTKDVGSTLTIGASGEHEPSSWSGLDSVRSLSFSDAGVAQGAVVFAGYGLKVPPSQDLTYDSYFGLDVADTFGRASGLRSTAVPRISTTRRAPS